MQKRTISAGFIALICYTILYYSHISVVIQGAAAALCCFCVYELACATGEIKNEALFTLVILAAGLLSFWNAAEEAKLAAVCLGISLPFFTVLMLLQPRMNLKNGLSFTLLSVLVCTQLRSIVALRGLPFGLHLTMISITECFATDVAAYLVGSKFGKRKLLPSVSPNKTLLGSGAGMVSAVGFCLLYAFVLSKFQPVQVNYRLLIGYALCANVLAQFGDLSMSVVKRITGIKDYGQLIPGHGGLLDRFDSLIFVIPFTLLFFWFTGGFFR